MWTVDTARKRSEAKFTDAAAKKISGRYEEKNRVKANEISTVEIKKDSNTPTAKMTKSHIEATEIEPVDTSPIQAVATVWESHEATIQTIDGLELYRRLKSLNPDQIKSRYRDWIKAQIQRCELRQGIDYLEIKEKVAEMGGAKNFAPPNPPKLTEEKEWVFGEYTISYKLSISAAKHIAIVQKGSAAARVRKNLIQTEEKIYAIQTRQLEQAQVLISQNQAELEAKDRLASLRHPILGQEATTPSAAQISQASAKFRIPLTGEFTFPSWTLPEGRQEVAGDHRVNRAVKAIHLTSVIAFEKAARTVAQRVRQGMYVETVVQIGLQEAAHQTIKTIETFYKEINASEEELPLALLVELMQQSIR